jgi:nitronate monooxygenase
MNDLTRLLGCRLPILQAPMAGSQDHRLAAAVCQAGGLGALPAALLAPEALDAELAALKARTDQPFNVNFFAHTPPTPDAAKEQYWRELLAPFHAEFGVDPVSIPDGPGRQPFSAAMAEVIERHRPAVVSFHFGLPAPELLERVKATGARILSSATTVEEGLWLQERGVDAVIAQGLEAGGHRGHFLSMDLGRQLGTFALVPQLVDALRVPVIAAGGIADARGVRAALALGARGIQVGTAYLLCPEANTSALHRSALGSDSARHTELTTLFSGRPARGIVNRLIQTLGPRPDGISPFPLAGNAIGPLRAAAERQGSDACSPLWSGQHVGNRAGLGAAALTRLLAEGL